VKNSSMAPPPKYQLYGDLSPAVESALRASIDRFGVLVPVAKDQHGNILDGHQRARIADELGIRYPVNIIEVADEDEGREIARTLNEDRRAMPKAERLPVVKALREEGHSLRAIAGAVGVTKSQVERDLSGVPSGTPAATRGLDGKSYPARREPKLPEDDALRLASLTAAAIWRRRRRAGAGADKWVKVTQMPSAHLPLSPLITASPYKTVRLCKSRNPCGSMDK